MTEFDPQLIADIVCAADPCEMPEKYILSGTVREEGSDKLLKLDAEMARFFSRYPNRFSASTVEFSVQMDIDAMVRDLVEEIACVYEAVSLKLGE